MIAFLSLCALAQTPDEHWETIKTDHFRVYYPSDAGDWAEPMAQRLESIRAGVVAEVGFDPPGRMKILVTDPLTTANGAAFPFLHSPRMQYWVTPPDSESVLSNYGRFDEILATHETTHMVHMLRPSRNPFGRMLDEWFGYGPITRKAPRWVLEGYATVVEARLTGYGRPHSDARAAYLRSLARAGRLPTYGELNGNANWRGMGDAYLVGSAYLEWLEDRTGAGSLRSLWARMSARHDRSFDESFSGLFGDSPAALYGRFCAEMTAAAVDAEERRPEVSGDRFVELSRDTSTPAVSPDGKEVAAVVSDLKGRGALTVWDTAIDDDAEAARIKRDKRRADHDPEDVADIDPKARPHHVAHTRHHAWREPVAPRWIGDAVLFASWVPDGTDRLRPDLFEWTPGKGDRRITRRADLMSADPAPDGTWAVAVHVHYGATSIVKVSLPSGAVTPLVPAIEGHVVDHPRVSPDGTTILWLENAGQGWGLRVAHADGSEPVDVPIPEGASISDPAWDKDGSILASIGVDGFPDVWRIRPGASAEPITRTPDGAIGPEPMPDGSVLYLSVEPDGMSIRRITPSVPPAMYPIPAGSPVFRVPVGAPVDPFQLAEVHPKPYGLGPAQIRPLAGGWSGQGGGISAFGLRVGDIVGRWEALGQVAWAAGTPGGARGTFDWKGIPAVDAMVGTYAAIDDTDGRWGADLTISAEHRFETADLRVLGGAVLDRPLRGDPVDPRMLAFGQISAAYSEGHTGFFHLSGDVRGRYNASADGPERLVIGRGEVALGRNGDLSASYEAGATDAKTALDGFTLGGVPTIAAPDAWLWNRLWVPGVAPGGSAHLEDAMAASVWIGGVEAFVERHRLGDTALGKEGTSLVGARIRMNVDQQPFVRLPGVDLELGAACRVEDPVTGVVDDLCGNLAEWSLWSGITWRP